MIVYLLYYSDTIRVFIATLELWTGLVSLGTKNSMYVLTKKEYVYLSMYDGGISVVLTVQEWLSQPVELL